MERFQKILTALSDSATKIIDAHLFYVALFNKVTATLDFPLVVRKKVNVPERPEGQDGQWVSRPCQPDKLLPDCIFASGKPVLIEQDFENWIAANRLAYPTGELPLSWMGVPIATRGNVIGVIVAENYERKMAYDKRTCTLLSTMADRVASSIMNVRLVENLRAVNRVGQKLTSGIRLREDEVLELIFEQASPLMDTRNMYIALYNEAQRILDFPLMTVKGKRLETFSREVEIEDRTKGGLTEEAIRLKCPLCLPDVQGYCKENRLDPPVKPLPESWLGVPMLIENRVLGVIALQNYEFKDFYGQDDQEVLQTMASQAAVAIENARLLAQESRRARQLAALQKIGVTITSQLELAEVLGSIVGYANMIMEADFATMFLYDSERDCFESGIQIRKGKGVESEPSTPSNSGLAAYIAKTQEPVFVEEPLKNPPPVPHIKVSFIREHGIKAFAGIPLKAKGKPVGVLFLNFCDPHNFSQEEKGLIQLLANQAAVAIENAKLYDEMEKRIEERTHAWKTEELKRLEAEQWAYLGQIAGSLAHRVGNKGGMIRLCVKELKEYLENHHIQDAEIVDLADTIERNNNYLLKLSDFLFRPQQGTREKLERADVRYYLEDALRYANIPKDVEVERRYAEHLPLVWGHKYLVEAFVEIIVNAVNAMQSSETKKLAIDTTVEDNWVTVQFSDTGRGIPSKDQEIIFELFARGSDQDLSEESPLGWEGHRGFGLWWVKTFLRAIKGEIHIESTSVQGTTLAVRLRAVEDADDQQA